MKYCKNCGTELSEGQEFCPNCGTAAETTNEQVCETETVSEPAEMKPAEKKQNINVWAVVGTVVGAIIIIFGLSMFISVGSNYYSAGVYGADYYTEVASRLSSIANNLVEIQGTIAKGFGFLLTSLGAIDICYFGKKIKK